MATPLARFVAGRRLLARPVIAVALGLLGLALGRPVALAAPNGQASTPAQVVTSFLTAIRQRPLDSGAPLPYLSSRLRAQVQSPGALLALVGSPGGFVHCQAPLQSFSVAPAQVAGAGATVTATLTYTFLTGLPASDCMSPPPPGPVPVTRTFTLLLANGTWQIDASAPATTPPAAPAQVPQAPASPVAQTATIPAAMPSTGGGGGTIALGGLALLGLLLAALGSLRLLARR